MNNKYVRAFVSLREGARDFPRGVCMAAAAAATIVGLAEVKHPLCLCVKMKQSLAAFPKTPYLGWCGSLIK